MKTYMRRLGTIAVTVLLEASPVLSQTWSERGSAVIPRWNPASVEHNGKIYLIGGQGETEPGESMASVEMYDPESDTWDAVAPMETDRWGHMVASVNGRIYVIGGQTGSFYGGFVSTDAVEEYNPILDIWETKAPMPTARGWGGCAVFNDTIFAFGGYQCQNDQTLTVVEKYHPSTDTWIDEPSMPAGTGRLAFMTAVVDERIYLIGGWNSKLVQEYDPVAKTWDTGTPMPTRRGGSGIAVAHGKVYVVGGRGGNSNECEMYDPVVDAWMSLEPMPTPREGLTACSVDDKLYAIAGSDRTGYPFYAINEMASKLPMVRIDDEFWPLPSFAAVPRAYPNPFATRATIEFQLPMSCNVSIAIHSVSGHRVRTVYRGIAGAGQRSVSWDGTSDFGTAVPAGIYLCTISAAKMQGSATIALVR